MLGIEQDQFLYDMGSAYGLGDRKWTCKHIARHAWPMTGGGHGVELEGDRAAISGREEAMWTAWGRQGTGNCKFKAVQAVCVWSDRSSSEEAEHS